MARIVVEDHSGTIWRGSNIVILVDGIERAMLKRNIRADFVVNVGKHTIQAQRRGAQSMVLNFVVAVRDTFTFSCFSEGLLKKGLILRRLSQEFHQDRF